LEKFIATQEKFIATHVEKIRPVNKELNLAYWDAATTGKAESYDRLGKLEFRIRRIYSNPEEFALLKSMKQSGQIRDVLLSRQLDVLYNAYLKNQIDPELLKRIVDLSTEAEEKFSTFRGTFDGRKITDNEIREMLKIETGSPRRKKAWLAAKQVGPAVAAQLVQLVKLRNQAAQKVGFEDYRALSLAVTEQDAKELDRIFGELCKRTDGPFAKLKVELDEILAARYGVDVDELMPWHYHDPFFQEAPLVYDLDLDAYYEEKDVRELAARFYDSIGLPVESVLDRSDLYEREGKNPHAFCMDIDRRGDVRISPIVTDGWIPYCMNWDTPFTTSTRTPTFLTY
jgi:peptidyl-dipeptidase A